jgi:helix-turn-helix protein
MAESGIGATLRETRMRARIDISEVEEATKIRAKYLRAIENEEWDLLPGPIYVKSFLRTYGEFLRIDSRGLVDEYRRIYERPSEHESQHTVSSIKRDRERAAKGPLVPIWAWVLVVLVVVFVALWAVGHGSGAKAPASTANTGHHTRHHPLRHRHHKTAPSGTVTTGVPRDVTLSMVPTGEIYVCASLGPNKPLINGLVYQAGEKIPVLTEPHLFLDLGNASIRLTVNGKPYRLSANANAIGLHITPSGVTPDANAPTC